MQVDRPPQEQPAGDVFLRRQRVFPRPHRSGVAHVSPPRHEGAPWSSLLSADVASRPTGRCAAPEGSAGSRVRPHRAFAPRAAGLATDPRAKTSIAPRGWGDYGPRVFDNSARPNGPPIRGRSVSTGTYEGTVACPPPQDGVKNLGKHNCQRQRTCSRGLKADLSRRPEGGRQCSSGRRHSNWLVSVCAIRRGDEILGG